MPVTISGDSGITTPDLTDTSLTSGRVVYAGASGNLTGSADLVFDASNNLGIGTSSPTASSSNRTLTLNSPATFGSLIDFKTNETLNLRIFSGVTNSVLSVKTSTYLSFETLDTERMRIPAAGGVQAVTTISVGNATPSASGAGITFPATQSASSDANTLDDYDEYTAASSACTLALTVSVVWKLTKVGKIVTLTLPPTFGTCASAASNWTYGVLLPSKYRPANEITLPVGLKDNGVIVTGTMGMIYITTGGEIRVYKSFNGTDTFTNGTAIGIAQNAATSISWII